MSPADSTTAPPRHVAIIGGGIIGASTLYYLSRASSSSDAAGPLRATLIEEAPAVAPGASGKSGGFLALDWHGAATSSLAALSFDLHRQLAQEHGGEARWGYRLVDTLSLSFDNGGKARSKSSSKAHVPKDLDWVDTEHVTSSSSMGGGGTTAQVTPEPLVRHLVECAKQKSGFDTRLATRAGRVLLSEAGNVEGLVVKGADGKEETLSDVTDVVVAAGPWTGSLLKSLLPKSASPLPSFISSARHIGGSRAHSVVIRSSKPTSATCLFTEMRYGKKAGAPEVYCREDGTVYACGGSDNVPLPARAADVAYDAKLTAAIVEQCAALSPSHLDTTAAASAAAAASAPATLEREQACYLPVQSGYGSGAPTVAGDRERGLYVGAGHSCWGITLGPGTGFVLAELIQGKKPSADLSSLG